MKNIFCTCCGSNNLELINGFFKCKNCGGIFSESLQGSKFFVDLIQADNERQSTQFEKAKAMYQKIIETHTNEDLTDAYWGLFLCEHNVIFEENGKGEKFPSFYRINSNRVEDTVSYNKALGYAIKHNKAKVEVYSGLGEKIEYARQMYMDIASKTKPFDIFICFKNTDNDGNYTPDRQLAMDIYNEFSNKYKIFFSEKSLKNIKSSYRDYEPNIYYGLYTAQIMLLICSKKEYLESKWLKNEWLRFSKINKQGKLNKCIIPIFTDNFNPNDLPEELWHSQGIFDDRKIMINLSEQLESIINPVDVIEELKKEQERIRLAQEKTINEKLKELESKNNFSIPVDLQISNYVDAINKFLEIKNFEQAKQKLEQLKGINPNAFEAYYYAMIIENKITKHEELYRVGKILNSQNFSNAKLFAVKNEQKQLINDIKQGYERYFQNLINEINLELNNGNFENFVTKYNELIKFDNENFYVYYFGMFFNHEVTNLSELVKIPKLKQENNYVLAKKYSDGYKEVLSNFEKAYNNYFEFLLKQIEQDLKYGNFDDFTNSYNKLKDFNEDCFETQFYGLFYKNNVNSIENLAKTPNILGGKEYYQLLEKRKNETHFKLIATLENEVQSYTDLLIFDLKNSFEIKDEKLFAQNFQRADEYLNTFETYYYGIFYENKTFNLSDLKNVPHLFETVNYINAKKYATKPEEIDLINTLTNTYQSTYLESFILFEKEFKKINDFENLLEVYSRLNNSLGIISVNDLKKALYKHYLRIYYQNLMQLNDNLDDAIEKVKKFNGNSKKLHNIYNGVNLETKNLFKGASSIQNILDGVQEQEYRKLVSRLEEVIKEKNNIFNLWVKCSFEKLVKKETQKQKSTKFLIGLGLVGLVILTLLLVADELLYFNKDENIYTATAIGTMVMLISSLLIILFKFSYRIIHKKFNNPIVVFLLTLLLTILYFIGTMVLLLILFSIKVVNKVSYILLIIPYLEGLVFVAVMTNPIIIIPVSALIMSIILLKNFKLQSININTLLDKKVKRLNIIGKIVVTLGIIACILGILLIIRDIIKISEYSKLYYIVRDTIEYVFGMKLFN